MAALLFSRLSAAKRKEDGREGLDIGIQIGDELLTFTSDCEGGDFASLHRALAFGWKAALPSLKS